MDHDKILQDRLQETCQWVFRDQRYRHWLERTSSSLLWIHGDPGLGKSFLASSIIEELSQNQNIDPLPQVIYFYCKYSDEQKSTLVSVLRSMLLQLFESKSNNMVIWNELDRLRKGTILDHATAESLPSLIQAFSETAAQFPTLHCVIDGLDELNEPVELVKLLLELQQTLEIVFSVVIVSRKEEAIMEAFRKACGVIMLPMRVEDIQPDVSQYIQMRLAKAGTVFANVPTLYERIRESLESSDGVLFMWARLMLDELESKYFIEDAEDVLRQGPVGLGVLYDRILGKLDLQTIYTRRIFTLLLTTPQQLKVSELAAALQLDMENGKARLKKMMPGRILELIRTYCGTLVECERGNVAFKHFSIKQHLQHTKGLEDIFGFTQSHKEALRICLGYLRLDEIPNVLPSSGYSFENPLTSKTGKGLEFLPLATTNWYYHFRHALSLGQFSVAEDVSLFLESEHSVTWLVSHFALAGPDFYQQRSHQVVEVLKHWSNSEQASEPHQRTRRDFIRTWSSAFVQLLREWGPMLCQNPGEIYRITSSLFKEKRAKALLKRTTDVCRIDHLGARPQYDGQFHIHEDRFPVLHPTSNAVFTCGRHDIDCRSGDTGLFASRLKYSVAIPGFEGGHPLRAVFRPNDTELLVALQSAKHQRGISSQATDIYVLSITICPDSLPDNAFLTIKVNPIYDGNSLGSGALANRPWHVYNNCLFQNIITPVSVQPCTRLQTDLTKNPTWLARNDVSSLDFCGDGSRLFKTTKNAFLEAYDRNGAMSLRRQLEGKSEIIAISFSGRCVALLRNFAFDIYDCQEDLTTPLCLGSGIHAEKQWAEFSRDGLKLLIFSDPLCQPLCGKGSWRESSSRDLVIWQAEKNWRPANISRFRYGDSFAMGFWTRGSNRSGSRDPDWQYHSKPAIWTRDGKLLRALTLTGIQEWNMLDLDKLTQLSLQNLGNTGGHSTTWQNICLSSNHDLLYAIPNGTSWIQLIDIKHGNFQTATSLVPPDFFGLEQACRRRYSPLDTLAFKTEADSILKIDAGAFSRVDLNSLDVVVEGNLLRKRSRYASGYEVIDSYKFSENDMVMVASKITDLSLHGIKDSGINTLTLFRLKPLEKLWTFQTSTYTPGDSVLFAFHPAKRLAAWSTSHLGVYLCNYERPEKPTMIRDR